MKSQPPKLVLVEWVDSAQPLPGWRFLDDLPDLGVIRCQSVGWLVAESVGVLMLAPNIGGTFEQGSGFIRIPKKCVVRRMVLSRRSSKHGSKA